MKLLVTIACAVALALCPVMSQNTPKQSLPKGSCSIAGTVLDSSTGKGLPWVTVTLLDSAGSSVLDGFITKQSGNFKFAGLPYGVYTVKCTFMGYQPALLSNIRLTADNPSAVPGNILLRWKDVGTSPVVVTGEKDNVSYLLDKKVINLSGNPASAGGTVVDALRDVPSVSIDEMGNVTLRGSGNFQVLIDGRPGPASGSDALKSIPADAVESIELITNPSAKYDPDGTAGIINLVLRKLNLNGINGLVNASVGNGDKYTSNALFNYRLDNINFYTGVEFENTSYRPASLLTRELFSAAGDTSFFVSPTVNRHMVDKTISARGGIEYTIDPKNFISLSMTVDKLDYDRYFPSRITEWSDPQSGRSYFVNNDEYLIHGYYSTINSYFRKELGEQGHQVSSTVNAIIWDGNGYEAMSKYAADSSFSSIDPNAQYHKADADSRSFMIKYKADYVLPLSDIYRFEAGYNFDYTQDFSDYVFRDLNILTGAWNNNTFFSNNTKYYHTINAVYAMLSGELWSFGWQLGLRGEYFNRRLTQTTGNIMLKYEKPSIFPTLHISKKFEEGKQLQFSYSKRVQRPDVYALNPFPDYADDYIVSVGNPNLMPEFTDSWELNYQHNLDFMFLSLQTYHRQTANAMTRVLKVREDDRLWITSENVSDQYVLGGEMALSFKFFQSLRLNLNADFYRLSIKNHAAALDESASGNVFNGNASVAYNLFQGTILQFSAFYMGPKYTTDGRIDETYSFGFSARQFLFDRKLTLSLNGRNIFDTMKFRHSNSRADYNAWGVIYTDGPVITLGFSLNINNYEDKVRPEDTIEQTNIGSSGGY